jgi:hypothetical protein
MGVIVRGPSGDFQAWVEAATRTPLGASRDDGIPLLCFLVLEAEFVISGDDRAWVVLIARRHKRPTAETRVAVAVVVPSRGSRADGNLVMVSIVILFRIIFVCEARRGGKLTMLW